MKLINLYVIPCILLILTVKADNTLRNPQTTNMEIKRGIYIIKGIEGNIFLQLVNNTLYSTFKHDNYYKFRIYKKIIIKENDYDYYPEEKYYFIEEKYSRKKLYYDISKEAIMAADLIRPEDEDKFLWEINFKNYHPTNTFFEIKSKITGKYLIYDEKKEFSKISIGTSWESLAEDKSYKFRMIRIYKEAKNIKSYNLENEPIDLVIKYIDLNDTSLVRKDLKQIEKDKQNNELKYSLRSIFKNIPWVRKIFIIMPNDNIPFLNPKEQIQDKIIYIKDKTLLGFDSSSPAVFQFNLHKLKDFGLSENFILMDDDQFIAQPLNKSDFFYEENGHILPLLISTEYFDIDEEEVKSLYVEGLAKINEFNYHSKNGFEYRKILTLNHLIKAFPKRGIDNPLVEVGYTHNAIPLRISDIREVYRDIEQLYQYRDDCLRSEKRNMKELQPHILFMSYARNKYGRRVKEMSWKYYDLSDVRNITLKEKLFVVNREDKEYFPLRFKTEEEILQSLFPNPTKYEKEYKPKLDEKNEKEIKKEEPKKDEIRRDEIRRDEIRRDEIRRDEIRRDEIRRDEIRREEMILEEMILEEMKLEEMILEEMILEEMKLEEMILEEMILKKM